MITDVIVLTGSTSSLGERLRFARKLADISARSLDALAGSAEGYAALIESGERLNVGSRFLEGYCRVLGLSLDWLVLGHGELPIEKHVRDAVSCATAAKTGTEG